MNRLQIIGGSIIAGTCAVMFLLNVFEIALPAFVTVFVLFVGLVIMATGGTLRQGR